jgi:hypothetical protein
MRTPDGEAGTSRQAFLQEARKLVGTSHVAFTPSRRGISVSRIPSGQEITVRFPIGWRDPL